MTVSGTEKTVPGTAADLEIGGMTCASCAARVEKKLNRMPGVSATVNYATEKAAIVLPDGVTLDQAIATVEATGYTARVPEPIRARVGGDEAGVPEDADVRSLRRRLIISAVLSLPVLLLSMVPPLQFDYWQWLCLALATPVVTWGAWPFHRAAVVNLRHGAATMDTLISLGVTSAYLWSLYALFLGGAGDPAMRMGFHLLPVNDSGRAEIYLEVAAMVTVFILAGRYFEARAKRQSGSALRALLELGAKDAVVLREGQESLVPIEQVRVGDVCLVRPGEAVPTDGTVVAGASAVDASMVTGESVPVEVGVGEEVIGGTTNTSGVLQVETTRIGADTHLATIARLVEEAQTGKAPVQRLADRISAVFVPVVIVLAVLTLVTWILLTGEVQAAFTAAVAVLIVACPCALGLATPTALLVGTGRGAQLGVLIKGPQILESTRTITDVVWDKTGTLTTGRMHVAEVVVAEATDREVLLQVAGALERNSEHPIAVAITALARESHDVLPSVEGFGSEAGYGVRGNVSGREATVGRLSWLRESAQIPGDITAGLDRLAQQAGSVVAVAWDGQIRGALLVTDTVKQSAPDAVAQIRELGAQPVLLTGDAWAAADAVAGEVGIDRVIAEVLPQDKQSVVADLQGQGRVVAMVGDGVNDAAALAQADLGIAMGTGSQAAIQASDLTIVRGDPRAVGDAIALSRRTLGTIKGNLFWAFAYNVAAIPIAMVGLLNPMIAGAAMAFSSVFVVSNSLRLRGFEPNRQYPA